MKKSFSLFTYLLVSCAWGSSVSAAVETIQTPQYQAKAPQLATQQSMAPDKNKDRSILESLKKMRDPFKRPNFDNGDEHEVKIKSELESVPITDLKMVGVLTGPHKTRALIRAPSGAVFPVADGTLIGSQNGYVRKVLTDRVIVNEVITDILGDKEVVTSEIKLNSHNKDEKSVSNVRAVATKEVSGGSYPSFQSQQQMQQQMQQAQQQMPSMPTIPNSPVSFSTSTPDTKTSSAPSTNTSTNTSAGAPVAAPVAPVTQITPVAPAIPTATKVGTK
jgi:Tfp pilus assembly protein PilP